MNEHTQIAKEYETMKLKLWKLFEHDRKIVEGYELEVVGNEIYITEQVNNILFYKR